MQPIIGAEVDDPNAAFEEGRQAGHTGAVRQAAEGALDAARHQAVGVKGLAAEVDAAGQAGVDILDPGGVFLPGSDGDDLHSRMAQQNLEQFGGRVARPAQDGNLGHGGSTCLLPPCEGGAGRGLERCQSSTPPTPPS